MVIHEVITMEYSSTKIKETKYKNILVWRNIIIFIYLHLSTIYGFYLIFTYTKIKTTLFAATLLQFSGLGITAGAHRLWSHRSYKAKLPLRIFLLICNTLAFQDSVIDWCRDHRVHHKFTETNADPYNAKRGFFFSHIGWLLIKKHPDIKTKGKCVDLSDLYADPLLYFQKKYYLILMPVISFLLPTLIPYYFWNETIWNAWCVSVITRYCLSLNLTWLVNSAAHLWGNRPYDKNMNPAENRFVAFCALGEGWHNYHHCFPWDYKTAELGNYSLNETTAFIDFCSILGLVYDRKTVSKSLIQQKVENVGDGTYKY